jgi:glycosyltransferase involved in cell wall biosynthesis
MHQISHFVGLSGIGGVQRNFVEYIVNAQSKHDKFKHRLYTIGGVDPEYQTEVKILNIKKIQNLFLLIVDLISRKTIVHFYNNLSSTKVAFLLFFIPVCKLIIHERGTAWNQPIKKGFITRFNAHKASLIISNSKATKAILVKKFLISKHKITIVHNGINVNNKYIVKNKPKVNNDMFRVGFIGRLDSHKGVHLLVDAMKSINDHRVILLIAGDGPLFNSLKRMSGDCNNIVFIGHTKDPYSFLNRIDLLVVPSIREPLGNVCLEAGLCKVPVLAANIDGLPEIIKDHVSGELIDPTDNITKDAFIRETVLPEFVVNPKTYEIHKPLQINPQHLAERILELSLKKRTLDKYAEQLHNRVVNYFNIDRYTFELHQIYNDIE